MKSTPIILVHGGAGHIGPTLQANIPELHAGIQDALRAGQTILNHNGKTTSADTPTTSIQAVVAATIALENHPIFNAGRGSVLCRDGSVECSASLMCGKTGHVGAVTGVSRIKNAIEAAAALLHHEHNLLFGTGAEAFAREAGVAMVRKGWHIVPARRAQWAKYRDQKGVVNQPTIPNAQFKSSKSSKSSDAGHSLKGTVGAVAIDRFGNLAAATSTGGLVNQLPGRIGDSPLAGCGTWAENGLLALSATGDGDAFARVVFARRVADLIQLEGQSPLDASRQALTEVDTQNGKGGCILIDANGTIFAPHSSPSMVHGYARGDESPLSFLEAKGFPE